MQSNNKTPKAYLPPEIRKVQIDKEVTLNLQSCFSPPTMDNEAYMNEQYSNDPYKTFKA
jgi:hypothetical protein